MVGEKKLFQNFSSVALTVLERECFEDWEEKDELVPH